MHKQLKIIPSRKMLAVMAVTAVSAGAIAVATLGPGMAESNAASSVQPVRTVQSAPIPAVQVNIADVYEQVSPSVVSIFVEKRAEMAQPGAGNIPPSFEEFFQRFFGGNGPQPFGEQFRTPPNRQPGAQPRAHGIGSGFIVDESGLIVTNHHVIEGASSIKVELHDGAKVIAELVGQDEKTDLALLKINSDKKFRPVKFGASGNVRVGDWVLTVGNPFGVGKTATVGIISARHRDIGAGPFDDFLQIDAPINQGNSGGPAFNLRGEVIGVNTAIFSPSGGNVGIGFAIPSSQAAEIIADLKDDGSVERGWLGVHIQEVTDELAASLGLKDAQGALISQVTDGSPAARGGLQRGDVILDVEGNDVRRLKDLPRIVAGLQPGAEAEFGIWRNGSKIQRQVKVGTMPTAEEVASAATGVANGLGLAALNNEVRQSFGLGDDVSGVVITEISPDSPAARQGLVRGDVIVAVAGQAVSTPSEVASAFERADAIERPAVLLLVRRGDVERFVALPLRDA